MRLPFFVYGTLRPGEVNHAVLGGRASGARPAVLHGALLYDGPGYPYAVAGPGTARVHGDLIHPLPHLYDDVLADLDLLEGDEYDRLSRPVRTDAGATVTAWVYVAAAPTAAALRASGRPIPGGDWAARHMS